MSKGDAAHAAAHQHGIIGGQNTVFPKTVEQRLAALEARVDKLEEPPVELAPEETALVTEAKAEDVPPSA